MLTTHIPNDDSNGVVDLVEYHFNPLPQFQDIVDKIGEKGNFVGWLRISMKLGESPVICLGQYDEIFKHYIFAKKMWTHRGKFWLVPKDGGCGIMIQDFQS